MKVLRFIVLFAWGALRSLRCTGCEYCGGSGLVDGMACVFCARKDAA